MDQTQSWHAPVGVRILAVLEYVAGAFFLIFGIMAFFRGDVFLRVMYYGGSGTLATGGYPLIGLIAVVLGIIHLLLGSGLWNGKAWAYIWVIAVSIAYVVLGIIALATVGYVNYVSFILNALVLVYLLADARVKAYFSK